MDEEEFVEKYMEHACEILSCASIHGMNAPPRDDELFALGEKLSGNVCRIARKHLSDTPVQIEDKRKFYIAILELAIDLVKGNVKL